MENFVEQNVEVQQSAIKTSERWTGARVYGMAAICLCAGLFAGYVIRGPQRPKPQAGETVISQTQPEAEVRLPRGMPTEDHMKRMADKQAAPLIEQLKRKPNDASLLAEIAKVYVKGSQLPEAISYAERAVEADPKRVGNRADLASYLFYSGEPDKAIQQLQKALSYEPSNPQVLFNLGSIRLKSKNDKAGAIEAWTLLLDTNKTLPEGPRKQVEQAIARAKASTQATAN